ISSACASRISSALWSVYSNSSRGRGGSDGTRGRGSAGATGARRGGRSVSAASVRRRGGDRELCGRTGGPNAAGTKYAAATKRGTLPAECYQPIPWTGEPCSCCPDCTTVAWSAVRSSQSAAGPSNWGSHDGDAENGPVSWGHSWSIGTWWVCDSAFLARSKLSWQTYPHDARTRQSQHHPEGRSSAP